LLVRSCHCRSRWRSAASLPHLRIGCRVATCQSPQPVNQMENVQVIQFSLNFLAMGNVL
jgi:hypothetical protein